MLPTKSRFARSIATVSLSGNLLDKLEAAAAAGFDGVEIFENDLLTFEGTPADVRKAARDLGLEIAIFQPFRDFESMPEPQRARNMDRAERKFDVMQALGTDLVLVCSNTQPHSLDDDARAAADLREMAERAAKRGLRVGFEALAWGQNIRRWSHAWKVVQEADHPALGLILDSFHTLSLGDDPSGIAQVPGERIFFVQLADAPKLTMDVLSWSRHFRNFPGQGDLPVEDFTRAVVASGYRGPLSLEIFNDDFRTLPARTNARDGLRSLIFTESRTGVLDLPPPPVVERVEFLEFAVDEGARRKLATYLERTGFRRAGRHRSKDVDLYRQGDVSLVLNSEQDSAASEHFQLHGPSVCAFAVRVDDVGQTLTRARKLLCSDWQEHRGEGELPISGIRNTDGTLILLVEAPRPGEGSWQDDFVMLEEGTEVADSGLTGCDHIALALPNGTMDSAVLFWRSVFGLEPQSIWDLADPQGLVRSRAVVSDNGTLRLPLNISEGQKTSTGRFVTAFAGAGRRAPHRLRHQGHLRQRARRAAARGGNPLRAGELLRRPAGEMGAGRRVPAQAAAA